MGGPPITNEVKNVVTQTWEQMTKNDSQTTAKEAHYSALERLKAQVDRKHRLPSLRAVQLIISKHKKRLEELKSEGISFDEEWTMASLAKYEFHADAVPFLIKIWRYAINTGHEFTVMQAKWVARLFRVFDDTEDLWYYSDWYYELEKSSYISGDELNTYYPDTTRFLTNWEIMTLHFTYFYQKKGIAIGPPRPTFNYEDGTTNQEILHYHERSALELFSIVPDASNDYHTRLFEGMVALPSLDSIGFDYDSKMVYLRWYSHLIKGPGWSKLTPKQAIELINRLRSWVLDEYDKVKNKPGYVQPLVSGPFPHDLLVSAGYEYKSNEEELR